jgi:hypothetical protein
MIGFVDGFLDRAAQLLDLLVSCLQALGKDSPLGLHESLDFVRGVFDPGPEDPPSQQASDQDPSGQEEEMNKIHPLVSQSEGMKPPELNQIF